MSRRMLKIAAFFYTKLEDTTVVWSPVLVSAANKSQTGWHRTGFYLVSLKEATSSLSLSLSLFVVVLD